MGVGTIRNENRIVEVAYFHGIDTIRKAQKDLKILSSTDGVTGLSNGKPKVKEEDVDIKKMKPWSPIDLLNPSLINRLIGRQ